MIRWMMSAAVLTLAAICMNSRAEERPGTVDAATQGMRRLFHTDFSDGDIEGWKPTDPKAWKLVESGGRKVYALTGKSDYSPPVRSPLNISILRGWEFGDFVYDVKLRSTTKDYNHRDLCLVFGYQDPSHFYYVHLALVSDPHANSIFIVNGAPRLSIAKTRNDGTKWTDDFHAMRVVRKVDSGEISVFFDDMTTPIMTAVDKTFSRGLVGLGSFDDTGEFAEVTLWGPASADAKP